MKVQRLHATCGRCDRAYEARSADLSFSYGTFIAVSRNGALAELTALGHPVWDEVDRLLTAHPAARGLDPDGRRWLLHHAVELAVDPDPEGAPYCLSGSTCPRCGSRSTADHRLELEGDDQSLPPVPHERWDALGADDRARRVDDIVHGLWLGTAGPTVVRRDGRTIDTDRAWGRLIETVAPGPSLHHVERDRLLLGVSPRGRRVVPRRHVEEALGLMPFATRFAAAHLAGGVGLSGLLDDPVVRGTIW